MASILVGLWALGRITTNGQTTLGELFAPCQRGIPIDPLPIIPMPSYTGNSWYKMTQLFEDY